LLPELPPISDYLLTAIPLRLDSLDAIGLKDRVEALGGTISVVSPPGEGTTLHVRLRGRPSAAPTLQHSALGARDVKSAP